jgi:hypothetical protein
VRLDGGIAIACATVPPGASVGVARLRARARSRPARRPDAIAPLEGAGDGEEPSVDREQVGLRRRSGVRHRDPKEDLPLALGIPDGTSPRLPLRDADLASKVGSLIQEPDDPAIQRVDSAAESTEVR